MQPQTSASPFAPTTPAQAAQAAATVPTYKPLNLKAYDDSITADPNQSAADIQSAFSKFEASRRNPLDIYTEAVGQLGVGDVRTRVQNLRNQLLNTENLLNNVDSSVTGRTQGSLVTEAQRQRLVNLEREPITKDYKTFSDTLGNENATLSDLLRQAESQTNLAVQGQGSRAEALKFALEQATNRERALEESRRFQQEMALKQQELNATLQRLKQSSIGLSLPNAPAAQKVDPVSAATGFAKQMKQQLLQAGGAQPFARERVRDQLVSQFGLSPQQANNIIYNNVFPDNWAGGSLSKGQQKSLMSAVGYSGAF